MVDINTPVIFFNLNNSLVFHKNSCVDNIYELTELCSMLGGNLTIKQIEPRILLNMATPIYSNDITNFVEDYRKYVFMTIESIQNDNTTYYTGQNKEQTYRINFFMRLKTVHELCTNAFPEEYKKFASLQLMK